MAVRTLIRNQNGTETYFDGTKRLSRVVGSITVNTTSGSAILPPVVGGGSRYVFFQGQQNYVISGYIVYNANCWIDGDTVYWNDVHSSLLPITLWHGIVGL